MELEGVLYPGGILLDTSINHKGLQWTANEYAGERRICKDLISKNNNVDILILQAEYCNAKFHVVRSALQYSACRINMSTFNWMYFLFPGRRTCNWGGGGGGHQRQFSLFNSLI